MVSGHQIYYPRREVTIGVYVSSHHVDSYVGLVRLLRRLPSISAKVPATKAPLVIDSFRREKKNQ